MVGQVRNPSANLTDGQFGEAAADKARLMAVVDHYVSVKRAPAPGATARWPGNKQFDDVLLGRRYRLRTRPGVAGRWLGGPKPAFDLMLNRQTGAPAENAAGNSGYHKLRNTKACRAADWWCASAPGGRGRGVPGCVSARGAGVCGQTDSVYRPAAGQGAEVVVGDHVAPGREVKRSCGAGRNDVDHGARRWVFDLFAQAQQERGAEQSGAVDGEVGWGDRVGGP
ncbi:hypothetical protein GCM10010310_63930 [Streptomyces violaceolatus]|uniref:Uncharacterized protein n=1 Tax=Streptomyces violaceolatus TaxID=67378 RepID=A0ABN3TCU3_9ACTN